MTHAHSRAQAHVQDIPEVVGYMQGDICEVTNRPHLLRVTVQSTPRGLKATMDCGISPKAPVEQCPHYLLVEKTEEQNAGG